MSITKSVLEIPCDYCGSPAGKNCRTLSDARTGLSLAYTHKQRVAARRALARKHVHDNAPDPGIPVTDDELMELRRWAMALAATAGVPSQWSFAETMSAARDFEKYVLQG